MTGALAVTVIGCPDTNADRDDMRNLSTGATRPSAPFATMTRLAVAPSRPISFAALRTKPSRAARAAAVSGGAPSEVRVSTTMRLDRARRLTSGWKKS